MTGLATDQLPGLTAPGVWFFHERALWLAPYAGGAPERLWADVDAALAPRPAPDGVQVAYACAAGVCLAAADGTGARAAALSAGSGQAVQITWSPDGEFLAVVDRDANNRRPVRLWVFTRAGTPAFSVEIAPRDVTDAPQWTLDGRALLIQTYPQDGRRIIAVDVPTQQVFDLSQEHWDAYFALLPDGRTLLLNNGRGDFWAADLLHTPGP